MCNSYTMVLRDYRSIIPMLPWYNILYHSYSSDWLEEIVVEKFFDYKILSFLNSQPPTYVPRLYL